MVETKFINFNYRKRFDKKSQFRDFQKKNSYIPRDSKQKRKWFDLVAEIFDVGDRPLMAQIQFSAMPSLQQPFNIDCCLYRIVLLTEFFCNLSPPCAVLEKPRLAYGSSGILNETIAYCLVVLDMFLYLISILHFYLAFIFGIPTPLWLFNLI